jgi:hypothetical protein
MVDAKLAISPHDFRTLQPHEILLNKRFHGGTDIKNDLPSANGPAEASPGQARV